jgi:hypothetical protein
LVAYHNRGGSGKPALRYSGNIRKKRKKEPENKKRNRKKKKTARPVKFP